MAKDRFLWLVLVFILPLMLTCTNREITEEKTEKSLAPTPSFVKKTFEQELQDLMIAAKKEGKVVIFNSGTFVGARDSMVRNFKEKYGIDIEFTAGGSTEIDERQLRERRAGIYSVDVRISGSTSFYLSYISNGIVEPLESVLILPEVLDPNLWVGGELPYLDPQKHGFAFGAGISPQFLFNTNLVKLDELKSFRDLLNPKWKSKITMHDPRGPGAAQQGVSVIGSMLLGWDTIRELAKQEPFITRDHYQLVDGVAKGKYSIAVFIQQSRGADLERAGAPVKMITLPDASYRGTSGCAVGLINKAPHPNAAKLFINWLLSKEGQTSVYRYMGVPSARLDVPTEGVSSVLLLDPSGRYFSVENMEWALKQPERDSEIDKIFGPLLK